MSVYPYYLKKIEFYQTTKFNSDKPNPRTKGGQNNKEGFSDPKIELSYLNKHYVSGSQGYQVGYNSQVGYDALSRVDLIGNGMVRLNKPIDPL